MGFLNLARPIADPSRPLVQRKSRLRQCIARYCRLANLSFAAVFDRMQHAYDLNSHLGLCDAFEELMSMRDRMLGRLDLYASWKHRRRWCSPPAEVRDHLFKVPQIDETSDRQSPCVYVVWSYVGRVISGWLVHHCHGNRANLVDHFPELQPMKVCGPFTGGELAAYLCLGTPWSMAPGLARPAIHQFMNSPTIKVRLDEIGRALKDPGSHPSEFDGCSAQ